MPFRAIPYFDIPHNVVRNYSLHVMILPVSHSDKAHFRVRYGAFQPLKWAILHADMVLFAVRKNAS
mgnify:CR=1 FL=1